MTPQVIGIFIAVVALIVSIFNASAGITNFILSRFRLLGVREIQCRTHTFVDNPVPPPGSRLLTLDVVSYGAAIWDMQTQIEFEIPDTKRNVARGLSGRIIIGLRPAGKYINPLNAGQGLLWQMWSHEMLKPEITETLYKALPHIPHKNISLCIYCNQKRKLLRRIRHPVFHHRLDTFLEGKMKVKLPRYVAKYLAWKERDIWESGGRSLNTISRTWRPPWKQRGELH